MEAWDVGYFDDGGDLLPEKQVTLLPDGTVCYAARYAASRGQCWSAVAVGCVSTYVVAALAAGRTATLAACLASFGFVGLVAWHVARYRRYAKEVRAGCHMQGVFLFSATRDVVVRFHRPFGFRSVEASFAKDTIVHVDVARRCFTRCLVVESVKGPGHPPRVVIPAAWLVDDPHLVARAVQDHLQLSSARGERASFGGARSPFGGGDASDLAFDSHLYGYEGSYRGPANFLRVEN